MATKITPIEISTDSDELFDNESTEATEVSYENLLGKQLTEQKLIKNKLDHILASIETIKKCVIFFTAIVAVGVAASVIILLL